MAGIAKALLMLAVADATWAQMWTLEDHLGRSQGYIRPVNPVYPDAGWRIEPSPGWPYGR